MTDIKKILIASICVVLAVAIAAGVSIGVLAGTVNGLKDTVAELQQANDAQEALNASMKAELDAAKANGENIVTAEEFETKLAAALGEQNQTMQALISTAVKNQIEELETEGLTEAQVQEIIDAAVANCLTEADIDAIVAGVDSGLTKDEVKKIVADYTVGTLTYGQIVDLIDDADYDLRVYLEKQINAVIAEVNKLGGDLDKLEGDVNTQAGKVASITLTTDDANADDELIIDADVLATLLSGGTLQLYTETWTAVDVIINYEGTMPFNLDGRNATIANLYVYAPNADIIVENLAVNGNVEVLQVPYNTLTFNNIIVKGNLVVEEGHVIVEDSTVENITVDGVANVSIGEDTTVETVVVTEKAKDATVSNEGAVGEITVNADATVSNEGTVESIVVGNEDAVIENNGTVEDITGSGDLEGKYVTYDSEKDGSLDAFVKAAEDGAIIYIPAGKYTANQINVNKAVSLIGVGDVVISGKQSNEHVILVDGTKDMVVNISNITIDYAGKAGVYVRTSTVNLDNVTIANCGWGAFQVDNSYTGNAVVVSIENSDIEKVALHSLTENAGVVTFTYAESDIEFIEVKAVDAKDITINGKETTNTTYVFTADALVNAIEAGISVTFANDIKTNVTITQKEGVDLVIDGNGYTFNGVMTVFGDGRQKGEETLTIKNINFVAAKGACIVSPDRTVNNKYSYSHNVTVDNCTFTAANNDRDYVAISHEDGGDMNWTVKNCTVDSNMHSLLQINNVAGKLTVENCVVESKNGLNLNSCTNVEIIGCEFDTVGYAIRFGVNSGGNLGTPKSYVIKDSTLKSACDDGDAVIIFRKSAVDAVMTLENTTLVGTTEISGNTDATTITKK